MRKLLLTIIICLLAIAHGHAVKANSVPFEVTQPDGTTLTVVLHGDENFKWHTTTDGIVIMPTLSGFRIADISADGDMTPTAMLAHDSTLRTAAETALAKAQNAAALFSEKAVMKRQARRGQSITKVFPPYFPHEGSPTALVILAEFADTKFSITDPAASFEQYLNGGEQADLGHGEYRNYGSVAQYFSDMSNGTFTPKFKVVGPVTLPYNMAHYGADINGVIDANIAQLGTDACALASQITDFADSQLDANKDNTVDLVVVIHAWFGENNGASDDAIWSQMVQRVFGTYAGKTVRRMLFTSELNANENVLGREGSFFATPRINGIGVFCHEFGHCMGLPDLYPTVASAQTDNQGMEYWSLMDGGSYADMGYCPRALTAWERETMGWHTPSTITADGTYSMKSYDNGGESYRFCNPDNANDYIMLENIQNTAWNSKLPSHGLLAYRVNCPEKTISTSTKFNNEPGRPRMTVIPADGMLLSTYEAPSSALYKDNMKGDLFPGTSGITTLKASQNLPNFRWYADDNTSAATAQFTPIAAGLSDISEDITLGTVSFTYWNDVAAGIDSPATDTTKYTDRRIFTTSGMYAGNDINTLPKGIYIINGQKIVK